MDCFFSPNVISWSFFPGVAGEKGNPFLRVSMVVVLVLDVVAVPLVVGGSMAACHCAWSKLELRPRFELFVAGSLPRE